MGAQNAEAEEHKTRGNEEFRKENWAASIAEYTKAIGLAEKDSRDLSVYFKNRAAAHLKLQDYTNALRDCDSALEIVAEDPKALFRRSLAYEHLGRYEEAYRDARLIFNADPNNKAVQPLLTRLHEIVQERAKKNDQTVSKIEQMFKLAFDISENTEKREKAMNNLLVLSKENAAADIMYKNYCVQKIQKLLKVEKNNEICTTAVRVIGQLCKRNVERTKGVIQTAGVPWFLEIIDSECADRVNAAQYCMQVIINSFSGMTNDLESKPDAVLCEQYKNEIDTLLTCLTMSITNRVITGLARDAIMELILRNCHYKALDWAEKFLDRKGLLKLLEVCSELEEYKYESAMNITPSSRTISAVCLSRIYENMYYDQLKEKFNAQIDEFVKDKLLNPDFESKVRIVVAITSLLLGPLDVGNAIISRDGIMQMILVMAASEDVLQQKVACECIIAAASKKDKAKAILKDGANVLKQLYKSKDDEIKVRALVGLCKVGSSGGLDASIRPFADGATLKLAEACRKFLINPKKDKSMRRWAAEGLSYLTLDAEVKEKLVEDRPAIQALIELARTGDQSALYGVVTTLVNLCNAYEKEELLPEMVELAKFAKHHIPEEHELDDPDFINKRISILAKEGVTAALVSLSKTESHNSKELISRVFNAVCSQQELRGLVVQQGGAKVLIPMALEGTNNGKKQAAQALSRIGITINPEVAFPGQRSLEVVRPLIALLHPDCSALENFEGLMALCNLAQMNETTRLRILKEGGLSKIEHYMYEDHLMLRRAATQCICNLVLSEDVMKVYEGKNDRTKYLYMLCQDDDEETVKAASGSLAYLTSVSKICCEKLFDVNPWLESLHCLLASPSTDIQYRGTYILLNIINSCKEFAEKVFATDVMEILMALSKLDDTEKTKVKEYATQCLKAAEDMKLIQKPGDDTMMPDVFEQHSDDDDLE